jgi:outer membrane lipoprotein-sorting protein
MRFLRTLSTRSLILLVVAAVVLAAGGAAIAVAAGGSGPKPPPKALDQAIHDALAAPAPDGITARVRFTNSLFPSGALLGQSGSALLSGASGRLWITKDGLGRIELQSDAGDVQVVWNQDLLQVYDASSNTVYRVHLPQHGSTGGDHGGVPALSQIDNVLSELGAHATISSAQPSDVGGRAAYSVTVSPKHDGGLLASARLAWDAANGVPLRVAVYAQGSSSPALALTVTQIAYGSVPASDVEVAPPAGAKVVDLGSAAGHSSSGGDGKQRSSVSGLAAVQAQTGFPVKAPATLVGLPRQDVRLVGPKSDAALVVYGHGLGAIVVLERNAASAQSNGPASSLPKVSLDGVTAHELATELGTVLLWHSNGTSFVLAGSLPAAAAEAAARQLQ